MNARALGARAAVAGSPPREGGRVVHITLSLASSLARAAVVLAANETRSSTEEGANTVER